MNLTTKSTLKKKIAFLFPGQGAQYPGMAKDFYEHYSSARQVFEEADDLLRRNLSAIILNGPQEVLTETKNSQPGIFIASIATLKVINELFPEVSPFFTAGLSLGEYTALFAASKISFGECLTLVDLRSQFMNDACEKHKGTMAVVMGLDAETVEKIVRDVNLPNDLFAANFNCPGQVVISGSALGVEAGSKAVKEAGAKRVLPLSVHGAFHSGLMKEAEERLRPYIVEAPIKKSDVRLVMNAVGKPVDEIDAIKANLAAQVTSPVRWEPGINSIARDVDLFVEIGCGKTLAGFLKRTESVKVPVVSIEKIEDLKTLESVLV